MLPSMRFYIISIVSIFVALGIGIFIGFTIDTQDFLIEQKGTITEMMETQFEVLINENKNLKSSENKLKAEIEFRDEYIDSSYEFIIENRLEGLNIAIIETNEDYITSGIGRDLELAGARVVNVTTLNNDIGNKEQLDNFYQSLNINIPRNSIDTTVTTITESIISGVQSPILKNLETEGFIRSIGSYEEAIDYLIICGGSFNDSFKRISEVDRLVVEIAKKYNIPILGVEKSKVNYSYMSGYKDLDITTVDNVDTTMGKVAMILAMEGIPGNYGIKDTSDRVIPKYNPIFEQ